MTSNCAGLLRLLTSVSLMTLAPRALAQEQPATADETVLREIVVTAQKRQESLQETPLSVSAVTTETIEALGITEANDLSAVAPNLIATATPSATANIAVFIRGIGDAEPILTVDTPVGLYVDGVVIGRTAGAIFDLVDLERVEVLRGPQGTLYGRNTTGGAINLITKRPADEPGVEGLFSYGRYNFLQARTSVDTGELGGSGVRVKFSYVHKEREGYFDDLNQPDDNDPGAYNVDAFRAALAFDQGGAFRANYAFDFNDRDSWALPFQLAAVRPDVLAYLNASPLLGGTALLLSRDRLDAIRLEAGPIDDKVRGHSLTLEVDLGDDLTLRSLTGYRKWTNRAAGGDLDGNAGLRGFVVSPMILAPPNPFIPQGIQPVNLFSANNRRKQDQWSQEFNLLGSIGDDLEFVLGAFYFTEDAREDNPQFLTLILPTPVPIPLGPGLSLNSFGVNISTRLAYQHESTSRAVFGQATWHLTDQLNLTGGLRYTKDKKELDQTSPQVRSLDRKFDEFTWSASVDYNWTDDFLTYARVATGYKSGGFNARSVNAGFDPETITSYEIGLKSELFDRRVRLNAAGFYSKYDDLQVQQFLAGSGGASSITVNAGSATYTGFELELTAVPVAGLTLNGALGYVDRDYKEFIVLDPATNTLIDIADEAKFGYSSSTTLNLGAQYEFPAFDIGQLVARLDYTYRGRIYFHPSIRFTPFRDVISDGSVGLLDGRLTLGEISVGGSELSVSLWGKNLTNEDYLYSGIDFGSLGFAGVLWAEKRTWGVDVKLEF